MDATIIAAPSSTKNRTGQRDPEMRQVKKGNQYHFGMKLHIGTDAETGLVHSFTTTSANVHDVTEAHNLLHGEERQGGGRCRIHWGTEAAGESGVVGTVAGGNEAGTAETTGSGECGGHRGKGEGLDTGQEPAPDCDRGWNSPS